MAECYCVVIVNQSINVVMNAGSAEPLCPYLYRKVHVTLIIIFNITLRSISSSG